MAGSKLIGRVRASTILEVVVSMVIIIVVFGISMMIYTNVLRLSLSGKKVRAQALLQETLMKAEQTKTNTTQTITANDFRIEQVAKPYNNDPHLTDLYLTAYDQNQEKICELHKIIINRND